ncbi:MAG: hypothetical protein IKE38_01015 [Erysipelotrichaceae bacterium]|nr:hypothetical protein [Erysipelotrichaceae bacterium]
MLTLFILVTVFKLSFWITGLIVKAALVFLTLTSRFVCKGLLLAITGCGMILLFIAGGIFAGLKKA